MLVMVNGSGDGIVIKACLDKDTARTNPAIMTAEHRARWMHCGFVHKALE